MLVRALWGAVTDSCWLFHLCKNLFICFSGPVGYFSMFLQELLKNLIDERKNEYYSLK